MSSNPKTTLGVLTMAAPIVLLGAICMVATVWYTFAQTNQIHYSGSSQTTICTATKYLQIFNGVCTRGVVNGIDAAASCYMWDDSSTNANYKFSVLDATNAEYAVTYPDDFTDTDTVSAAKQWVHLKGLVLVSIPLAILNFIFCLVTADVDIELWDIDFDKWTLVVTSVFNLLILITFLVAIGMTQTSEITQRDTWTVYDTTYEAICKSSASPSFGYFLMILGALFTVVSLYISIYCIIRAYVWPKGEEAANLLRGNFSTVKGTDVVPAFDEKDDDDEEAGSNGDARRIGLVPMGNNTGSRPSSANQIAPAPTNGFAQVVLG
jgi:hypothetical protein